MQIASKDSAEQRKWHRQTDARDPNPTSVSQTKFDAASTKEIHGFAVGSVDPKILDILVRRISKDTLEFGLDAAGIDLASSKARLSDPRWQPDDASSETRKID